jgi:hypothetical protein
MDRGFLSWVLRCKWAPIRAVLVGRKLPLHSPGAMGPQPHWAANGSGLPPSAEALLGLPSRGMGLGAPDNIIMTMITTYQVLAIEGTLPASVFPPHPAKGSPGTELTSWATLGTLTSLALFFSLH